MKIALIHGQNHKGCSYHVSRFLVEKLANEDDIKEFFLPKDMPKFCRGCYTCLNKGEEFCPDYEYIKPITQAIMEADLLVFTTPVYCLRTSGSMKALLDHYFTWYVVHRPKEEMYFKKAVIISSGAGTGMKKAASDIKDSIFYWGVSDIKIYKLRSLAMTWNDINEERRKKLDDDMNKLAIKIKANGCKGKVSLKTKIMFYLMRLSKKKGVESGKKDKEYWEKKGWLEDKRPWKNN